MTSLEKIHHLVRRLLWAVPALGVGGGTCREVVGGGGATAGIGPWSASIYDIPHLFSKRVVHIDGG